MNKNWENTVEEHCLDVCTNYRVWYIKKIREETDLLDKREEIKQCTVTYGQDRIWFNWQFTKKRIYDWHILKKIIPLIL